MTLKTERSGSRFVVAETEDGHPSIRLELFHDTVSPLRSFTVRIRSAKWDNVPEQVKSLVDVMNERIVGVVVTAK